MKNLPISKFEKANRVYQQILVIDEEILHIEKIANDVLTEKCSIRFSIIINKESNKKEETPDINTYDPREYLLKSFGIFPIKSPVDNTIKTSDTLTDVECLNVLGSILGVKYEKRKSLLAQMNKLGVEI